MQSQLLPTIALPPSQVAAGECGGDGLVGAEKSENFGQKINLDLGIGSFACADEGGSKKIEQGKKEPLFTAAQFQEFFCQILVYNSIVSGLPVPLHLFVGIWMSVYNSFGPAVYKKYPSLTGFCPRNSDRCGVMDPEPGRCRRTDGRKWRCSKSVIPNQKYCERHMHRGRHGSRKHVEPIESVSRPDNKTSNESRMAIISLVTSDTGNGVTVSDQGGYNPSQPCSSYSSGVPAIVKCRSSNKSCDALMAIQTTIDECALGKEVNGNVNVDYGTTTSTSINSMNNGATDRVNHTEGNGTRDRVNHAEDKESCFENVNRAKINRRKQQNVVKHNSMGFISPRFGLSPKSVLHGGAGKVSPGLASKNISQDEPQRCGRTDGKKWRCRRDAVPGQKYCEAHMHRGTKRFMLNQESMSGVPATSTGRAHHISGAIATSLGSGINLNSMPASPQRNICNNSTSSTSDATTITDENISFCLNHSLHNI